MTTTTTWLPANYGSNRTLRQRCYCGCGVVGAEYPKQNNAVDAMDTPKLLAVVGVD